MRTFFIFSLVILAALAVSAQTAVKKNSRVKFSSAYTTFAKDCKALDQEAEGIECKPVGRYRAVAGYGAVAESVSIATLNGKDSILLTPAKRDNALAQSGGIIEWRLANGKPFAVIARFAFYDSEKVVDTATKGNGAPYRKEFKTGELLIVKGLGDFARIDFQIEAKTPDANQKARDLADAEFAKEAH